MEAFGAQNTANANFKGRSAPARPFRRPGRVENDGAVIILGVETYLSWPFPRKRESIFFSKSPYPN